MGWLADSDVLSTKYLVLSTSRVASSGEGQPIVAGEKSPLAQPDLQLKSWRAAQLTVTPSAAEVLPVKSLPGLNTAMTV